ncbi:MAG: 5'/3'-nucleotidase SurE [Catalinimonas sp.]
MNARPLILVSNDDGITAPGIRALVELMGELGEVVVVAPDAPQSGMGHAITVGNTLRLTASTAFRDLPDVRAYECSGTPADCVKMAKHHVLKDRTPDLVVSGVNHGSNSAVSVLYSGTMSAAIEAAIEGLPAVGFSLCDYSHDADFGHVGEPVLKIARQVLKEGLPAGIALNVNIPKRSDEALRGIRICRQARAYWQERFDERRDPNGRRYFWLAGDFVNLDQGEDHDEWALKHNWVSVVPVAFDMTAYHAIATLNRWDIVAGGTAQPDVSLGKER